MHSFNSLISLRMGERKIFLDNKIGLPLGCLRTQDGKNYSQEKRELQWLNPVTSPG